MKWDSGVTEFYKVTSSPNCYSTTYKVDGDKEVCLSPSVKNNCYEESSYRKCKVQQLCVWNIFQSRETKSSTESLGDVGPRDEAKFIVATYMCTFNLPSFVL